MAATIVAAAVSIVLFCLLIQFEITRSLRKGPNIFKVGDDEGWDLYPQIIDWPNNKYFKEGDILVFEYKNPVYGVAKVDAKEYQQCQKNKGTKEYNSGNDQFKIQKGSNYFISVFPDYCGYGMRIQVDAQ